MFNKIRKIFVEKMVQMDLYEKRIKCIADSIWNQLIKMIPRLSDFVPKLLFAIKAHQEATVPHFLSPRLTAGPHLAHTQSTAPGGLAAPEKVMVTVAWGHTNVN